VTNYPVAFHMEILPPFVAFLGQTAKPPTVIQIQDKELFKRAIQPRGHLLPIMPMNRLLIFHV
jgi:hypothetical protein